MIITSCTDHKVRLWDASGKLLRVLGPEPRSPGTGGVGVGCVRFGVAVQREAKRVSHPFSCFSTKWNLPGLAGLWCVLPEWLLGKIVLASDPCGE